MPTTHRALEFLRDDPCARRGWCPTRSPRPPWGGSYLEPERVPGLGAARRAWERTWRGEVDPLTALTVLPAA